MRQGQQLVRWIGVCVLIVSLVVIVPAAVARAATIMVTTFTDTGGGGTCPGPACELRDAVVAAGSGGIVTFQPGAGPVLVSNILGPIILSTDVTIDGSGASAIVTAEPDTPLFVIINPATVEFRNLTLQNVLILSCGCTPGGAILSLSSKPLTITGVTFLNNNIPSSGAAIAMEGVGPGGATPLLTIDRSTFIGNHADGAGGAIAAGDPTFPTPKSGPISITKSTFVGNTSFGFDEDGGAIFDVDCKCSQLGVVTVSDSTFSTNKSLNGAGGAIATNQLIATNVTFSNNLGLSGGAVALEGSAQMSTLTNVTFNGNSSPQPPGADGGGAIVVFDSPATLTNVTISGNTGETEEASGSGGGGISNSGGTVHLRNTIVAGNSFVFAGPQTSPDLFGPFISDGNNLIGASDGSNGFTNGTNGDIVGTIGSPIDPKLDKLMPNDGSTKTLKLLPASPAIGAGNPAICAASPVSSKDQRGFARLATICDIGAYESQGKTFTLSLNPSSVAAGVPFTFTVAMADTFGDVLTRYTGTVKFTSDDPLAVLPINYPFVAGDNGQHNFPVTLKTPGPHTITVTDTQASALTATKVNIPVSAGASMTLTANAGTTPQSTLVGTNFGVPLSLTVKDAVGNPVPNAVVTFTAPASGASGTFVGGVNTATTNASGIATAANFTADTIPGTYAVNATVSGVGTPVAFTLTNTPPGIVVTMTVLPVGTVNRPYSVPLGATGGTAPYTFTVTTGAPPAGLSLSTAGVLSGTPTSAGQTTFTVTATDANGSTGSQSYTLVVSTATLTSVIVIAPQPNVRVGGTIAVRAVGAFSDGSAQDLTASVQWTASDTAKATVDAHGNVSGISAGSVTITATTGTLSGTATITVPSPTTGGIPPAAAPASRPGSGTTGANGQVSVPSVAPGRTPSGATGGAVPSPAPPSR